MLAQIDTKWILLIEIIYVLIVIGVCIRIIYDTRAVSKALAYVLFAVFVPVVGIAFYFSFGINYRKRKIYSKKLTVDEKLAQRFREKITETDRNVYTSHNPSIIQNKDLYHLLFNEKTGRNPLVPNNKVTLLKNGEALFPELIQALKEAQSHIHIEFYIYEDDAIGNTIKEVLIEKARQGVEVRFMYDDFGSRSIRKTIVKELRKNNIAAFPFYKIRLMPVANRINYRNHRKIVIIDGKTSFIGGINVSDRYINSEKNKVYWRDTHIRIDGPATYSLQRVFLSDWNFSSGESLGIDSTYFPLYAFDGKATANIQVVSSGPDSDLPNILYTVIKAISLAKQEILLTTPYYIPDEALQETLIIAALSGIEVKLLVPKESDSKIVNLACRAYFENLLRAGVRIFLYEKGFIHSKTFVVDRTLASVGTANLDLRSFDLNFEVATVIYDETIAQQLATHFDEDCQTATEIQPQEWFKRSKSIKVTERLVRLISPFM
ncbi:cardiolipin synthase [Flavobacterium beibuense]|uniref:cardiolipin synthase n=1 Tax=Flavobacterium beibuense TaxID=657326 RepID=UPI003A914664